MSEAVDRKREAKRQTILDVAVRLFAERGFHSTRMADIADELGLRKAALYYYFDSKEAILVELIRSRVGMALGALTGIVAAEAAATDKIDRAVRSHLRIFHEHGDIYTIFNSEKLDAVSRQAASIVDELGRKYETLWVAVLTEGVDEGTLRPDLDIRIAMKAILGMLNTTLGWFRPGGRLSIDELSDRYVDLTLRAIAGREP